MSTEQQDRGRDAQGEGSENAAARIRNAAGAPARVAHTPGPWDHSKDAVFVVDGKEYDDVALCVGDNAQANARLIAAAPELLEQLVAFCDLAEQWFGGNVPEEWRGRIECAKAAIRKAEGGAS